MKRLILTGLCLLACAVLGGTAQLPVEKFTPPARSERHPDMFKVGDVAPAFTLPDPQGKTEVRLASFAGKKPVVLIFGSCT